MPPSEVKLSQFSLYLCFISGSQHPHALRYIEGCPVIGGSPPLVCLLSLVGFSLVFAVCRVLFSALALGGEGAAAVVVHHRFRLRRLLRVLRRCHRSVAYPAQSQEGEESTEKSVQVLRGGCDFGHDW